MSERRETGGQYLQECEQMCYFWLVVCRRVVRWNALNSAFSLDFSALNIFNGTFIFNGTIRLDAGIIVIQFLELDFSRMRMELSFG